MDIKKENKIMATIKEYLDYAELAQASYVNGLKAGMSGNSYNVLDVDGKKRNIFFIAKEFTQTQATNFANRYYI